MALRTKKKPKPKPNYSDICSNANGITVAQAYAKLGPVNSFSDLLTKSTIHATKLAAEQIIHLLEAWRYLTSATNAYLINSKANTIHFAYYAQLRAAFSLYAFSGIYAPGVPSKKNFYLDLNGKPQQFIYEPTHKLAWNLWLTWVSRVDIENLMLSKIRLMPGVGFNDFKPVLTQFNTKNLTLNFGLDLCKLAQDHNARNRASYEPYWLVDNLEKMQPSNVGLISNLWGLLISNGVSQGFDVALIQYLVNKIVSDPTHSEGQRNASLIKVAQEISKNTGIAESSIYNNLVINNDQPKILELVISTDTKAENVLSRAFFMTHIATLAVKQNLSKAPNTEAKKWILNWLEHAGIWSLASGFAREDLQSDCLESLDEFSKLNLKTNLPDDLWSNGKAIYSAKVARPEASLAWALI